MSPAVRPRASATGSTAARPALRGTALLEQLRRLPFCDRDAWLDRLLGFEAPPPDAPDLPRGAVPYLPCGVEEIATAVREAPIQPDDQLVDLGSGLGRVAILVHLLSGARTTGIEIQEGLVRRARAHCVELGLTAVSFVHGNAADEQLDGSAFFLYAPFNGALLHRVLAQLAAVARRRRIVVCAVDTELCDVPWLTPRQSSSAALTLYDSTKQPR